MSIVTSFGGPIGAYAVATKAGIDASGFGGTIFAGVYYFGVASAGGSGKATGSSVVTGLRVQAPAWPDLPGAAQRVSAVVPPAPVPSFARGPKSSALVLSDYRRVAQAATADSAVVFYRWGIGPLVGAGGYWEFVASAFSSTLGGFGVGEIYTATDSEPGKGDNPGCMMYLEDGALEVWNNGASTTLGACSAGTRFGAAVQCASANEVLVRWFIDGVEVGSSSYVFDGPMWIPTLCTLSTATFRVTDYSLSFVPDGYVPLAQIGGERYDFERECFDGPPPLVLLDWQSDIAAYNAGGPTAYWKQKVGDTPGVAEAGHTVLYSWGVLSSSNNSVLLWTNTTGQTFTLGDIIIECDEAGIGYSTEKTQGQGACPAYEHGPLVSTTKLIESMIRVLVRDMALSTFVQIDKNLFAGYEPSATDTWYPGNTATTRLTPLVGSTRFILRSSEWGTPPIVKPNDRIVFRLYETVAQGMTNLINPDLVFGSMAISIYGEVA